MYGQCKQHPEYCQTMGSDPGNKQGLTAADSKFAPEGSGFAPGESTSSRISSWSIPARAQRAGAGARLPWPCRPPLLPTIRLF